MSASSRPSKSEATKQRIFDAADRLFRGRGVAETNVEHIAEAAGVSRATLYRHVTGGRDEIVRTVIAGATEDSMRRMVAAVAADVSAFDDRLVQLFIQLDAARRADEQTSAMFQMPSMGAMVTVEGWAETAIRLVGRVLEPILANARERGEIADTVDDRLVAEWLVRQFVSLELLRSELIDDPDGFETYVRTLVVAPLLSRMAVST